MYPTLLPVNATVTVWVPSFSLLRFICYLLALLLDMLTQGSSEWSRGTGAPNPSPHVACNMGQVKAFVGQRC